MWIRDFIDYLRFERSLSEKTVEAYQTDLEAFRSFYKNLDDEISWENVDADVVRQWMLEMMHKGNAASSVNRRLSSLRSFYRFLLKRKKVSKDPVYAVQGPKKEKTLPVYMREVEMDLLLDDGSFPEGFLGTRDKMMLLMFYSTGVRLSELVGMNLASLDMNGCLVKVTGKRNKQRLIPFGEEMCVMLQDYLKVRAQFCEDKHLSDDALFLDEKSGRRIAPAKVRNIVEKYLSLVTTQRKKSPHVLRHSFATSMLNHHADLQSVKELLGHESLSTTEIYTHTSFEELKEIYKQAHPRAKH